MPADRDATAPATPAGEADAQRRYYADTASRYDRMHVSEDDEHFFALRYLDGACDFHKVTTVLDIGAGTGRVARFLKGRNPKLHITSVEPVRELREIGHASGLSTEELVDGDATRLAFRDDQFDLVCEFGVLHHIRHPERAVREMLRVGRIGIFLSDCNNFGHGSSGSRLAKQLLNALGLWRLADFVKTRGKGYTISEGDGLAYSYSVFNDYRTISEQCHTFVLNTVPAGINPYRTASHVALLAIKKRGRPTGPRGVP